MEGVINESWIMDSGASTHTSKECGMFIEYTEEKNMRNVSSAKIGAKVKVLAYRTVALRIWNGFKWINAHVKTNFT